MHTFLIFNKQFKFKYLLTLVILMFLNINTTLAIEVTLLERVRYCNAGGVSNVCSDDGSTSPTKFSAWEDAGVSKEGQRNTYISIVSQPEKEKVRKVVFISAGQQTKPNSDGYEHVLTGQSKNYKRKCKNANKNCVRTVDAKSLTARLLADGEFSTEDTLFILAFDMRFGYELGHKEKQRRENAYWNFVTSQFNKNKVELIVLAGQSRGGCMMFRLGKKLRSLNTYKDIPLIIQGYDPVCTTTGTPTAGRELPALQAGTFKNPINDKYKSYPINMDSVFPLENREQLAILDIHGGGNALGPLPITAFTWKAQDTDLGWWKQMWVNASHADLGRKYNKFPFADGQNKSTVDVGIQHIYDSMSKFKASQVSTTNFRATPQHPVDLNGDGLSDILLRYRHPQNGLIIRSKLSNGNGTFSHKDHNTGDGSAVDKLPALSGYFNADKNTDILLRYRKPKEGLILRTKLSNGDGTFSNSDFTSGDGSAVDKYPAFVGDVDGDKLSDLILIHQHPTKGLHIRTKMANGDGTFRAAEHKSGDGPGALGETSRMHAADINGDKKTDLIYHFQSGSKPLEIRTQISNGDGTFTYKKYVPGGWWYMNNMQSFVGDVNRDRKSDLILITRDQSTNILKVVTYLSKGDGTFTRKIQDLQENVSVDKFEALVADVNGDRRTDILFRIRDPQKGLIIRKKISKGDGTYKNEEYISGDGSLVDKFPALIGSTDTGLTADLLLRARDTKKGLLIRTKMTSTSGSNTAKEFVSGDGSSIDKYPALSGALQWNGGGTFHPCGGGCSSNGVKEKAILKRPTRPVLEETTPPPRLKAPVKRQLKPVEKEPETREQPKAVPRG